MSIVTVLVRNCCTSWVELSVKWFAQWDTLQVDLYTLNVWSQPLEELVHIFLSISLSRWTIGPGFHLLLSCFLWECVHAVASPLNTGSMLPCTLLHSSITRRIEGEEEEEEAERRTRFTREMQILNNSLSACLPLCSYSHSFQATRIDWVKVKLISCHFLPLLLLLRFSFHIEYFSLSVSLAFRQ